MSAAALTHTLARACSAGRMERCTCDDSPGLESRQAWQWGVCGDNLKYSTKFLNNFLGPKRGSKDLRARADAHNTHVGIKVSVSLVAEPGSRVSRRPVPTLPPCRTHTEAVQDEPHPFNQCSLGIYSGLLSSTRWEPGLVRQERVWRMVSIPSTALPGGPRSQWCLKTDLVQPLALLHFTDGKTEGT